MLKSLRDKINNKKKTTETIKIGRGRFKFSMLLAVYLCLSIKQQNFLTFKTQN